VQDTIWGVLAGIVSGLLSGTITAHMVMNRLTMKSSQRQSVKADGDANNSGRDLSTGVNVRGNRSQNAQAGRDARVVGRDDNSVSGA
jgi:hypothetical protein